MLAEAFDHAGAEAAWQESIRRQPSAWAYRNLAALRRANDNLAEALDLYAQAWQLALHHRLPLEPFAHEYLSILIQSGGYQAAWDLIAGLPAEAADSDRVQILRAMAALELGQWDVVEQILGREFATVREGQVDLTNVWFAMWRRRIAQAAGRRVEDVSWAEVVAAHPAPRAIDFRSAE
jgi:hypothetical protein